MRKEIYAKYSLDLAIKICDIDPSAPWTILGVGPLSVGSEKQQSEPVTEVIVAPLRGSQPSLNEAILQPFPIGCIDFFQLRRSWFKDALSEQHFRSSNVSEVYAELDTGHYTVCTLGELWDGKTQNDAIKVLKGVRYLIFDAVVKRTPVKLAVPCSEILRFYYSPSSNFASATLSGKTAKECIYNPENREATEEEAKRRGFHCVTLRKSIEDYCAPYVGRIALSSYARESFDSIFPLTSANYIENPEHYLICRPPLAQKTSWDIDGIYIEDVFFVTRIKRCFGAFPFKQVLFDRDNNRMGDRKNEPKETKIITKAEPVINELESSENEGGGTEQDGDKPEGSDQTIIEDTPTPSIYVDAVKLEVLDGNPIFSYLDLADVGVQKVIKATIINEDLRTITVYDGKQIIDKLTTTPASGGLGNRKIAQLKIIRLRRNDDEDHDFTIYDVMTELEALLLEEESGEVGVYFLDGEVHAELDFASVVPFYEYKNEKLCFINDSDRDHYFGNSDSKYLRPMVCFRITYMKQHYFLVEFLSSGGLSADGTSTLFFSNFSDENPDELIKNEIRKFDKYGSKWKLLTVGSEPEPSSKFSHRFVHRKTDIERKVSGIFKELKRGEKERSNFDETVELI